MTGGYIDRRQLNTKATAVPLWAGDDDAARLIDAMRGSLRLRDAVLLAKGITPPAVKIDPRPIPVICEEVRVPVLCEYCGAPAKPMPTLVAHIQQTVAAYYGLDPSLMVSAQRRQSISHPRQVAMFLASQLTPKSLPEIGRRFGGRDHTTVMHAIRVVTHRIEADAELALDVEVLRERLS